VEKSRYIADSVKADLVDCMVFIGGPRQVGKTTFALSLLEKHQNESSSAYLSWDVLADREAIMAVPVCVFPPPCPQRDTIPTACLPLLCPPCP
jgi:predicted AAA+ superfamily ATPase